MQARTVAELLQHAKGLLGAANAADVLLRSCTAARRLTGARIAFGVCVDPGQSWEHGLHLLVADDPRPPTAVEKSALFAVHRQLARNRKPLRLQASGEGAVIHGCLGGGCVQAVPIISRSGRLFGEIVVSGDPDRDESESEAVLAETALLASSAIEWSRRLAFAKRDQQRLHLLAEASEEALWDWSIEAGEMWWGGGIQDVLGGVVVETRPEWKFSRIHPDDVGIVRRTLETALHSPASSWRQEYRFRRADDSWITVEDRGYFLREPDGRAYRVVGSVRNISPLKTLLVREQEARAAAEAANRAKDDFLAMLGHELRNPLAPIVTALQLIKMRGVEAVEHERTVIERQTRHMVRLVDDLLDISRITRGVVTLELQRQEVATLVTKAIEMASPLLEERRHYLSVEVPAQGLTINADPARFAQVIANLLNNAARYTPHGGRISISARRSAGQVELSVEDSGVGIPGEMLPTVFEMFVQGAQAIDRAHGGLGLGLSIVRSLIGLHGGSVSAHSDGPGCGARFVIRVPLAAGEAATAPPETAPIAAALPGPRLRILVVDDNDDAARLLANYLKVRGHAVEVAQDGPAALRAATEATPEIVLLDIGLPVIDGYEVARLLRQRLGTRCPALVAVTGYGHDAHRRRIAEIGFNAHLVKPVDLDELDALLLRLAARRDFPWDQTLRQNCA